MKNALMLTAIIGLIAMSFPPDRPNTASDFGTFKPIVSDSAATCSCNCPDLTQIQSLIRTELSAHKFSTAGSSSSDGSMVMSYPVSSPSTVLSDGASTGMTRITALSNSVPLNAARQWEVVPNSSGTFRVVFHTFKDGNCAACDSWLATERPKLPKGVDFSIVKDLGPGQTAPTIEICRDGRSCSVFTYAVPVQTLLNSV